MSGRSRVPMTQEFYGLPGPPPGAIDCVASTQAVTRAATCLALGSHHADTSVFPHSKRAARNCRLEFALPGRDVSVYQSSQLLRITGWKNPG